MKDILDFISNNKECKEVHVRTGIYGAIKKTCYVSDIELRSVNEKNTALCMNLTTARCKTNMPTESLLEKFYELTFDKNPFQDLEVVFNCSYLGDLKGSKFDISRDKDTLIIFCKQEGVCVA